MRIANQKVTVRSIVFSRPVSFIYFLIFLFFLYKCVMLLPIWLATMNKTSEAKALYEKKQVLANEELQESQNNQTSLGKLRYQKDFFNKLDEGERMIVLYKDNDANVESMNEDRQMFWWEKVEQDFLVWWRNLEIIKK